MVATAANSAAAEAAVMALPATAAQVDWAWGAGAAAKRPPVATAASANASVTIGGSGDSRTLTIAPVANAFGATTITVRAEDESGLTTQQTFMVTVTAVNDAPAITAIPNQAMLQDARALVLPFAVSDVESAAGALTLSIVVERSVYSNTNGVTWAAGTNATATPLP